ncbi:MAG: serine/threonine-protein kinase, partial [Sulfitobacter sp.]|nr:serine/threonine-protein kinase [Sulfitobacter sp.]
MTRPDSEKLFHTARSMSPEARDAYLEEAAEGDSALIANVLALLNSDQEAGSFLGTADSPEQPTQAAEAEGDWIGRFRLLQQIGEGGMGTVWMAEQVEPYKRKVALKVIKLGMDTKEVVVRFEAERQALALMDHPHIARVIDGGATAHGRPYFVMELVRGVPITEYCNQAKLGLRDRLELFSKVCDAVQHAHQKGVIHRDIKPSNVMVTLHDGVPVPKVIDFGIAKATSAELTQKTLFTQYSQIVGTPEYMAPEQAEMSGLDIDTRADVYSLGVLLYELLTGTKPFDLHKALEVGYMELLRTIREVDPQRPSTRVSTLGEKASVIAMNQHANVESLSKRLRGELDWIVMKALEKDRTRRYETANGFSADIARFLTDTPVTAVPPSAGYQLRKFVRRNRGRVIAASLLVGVVVLGLIGTTTGMLWAVEEKKAAEDAREQALQAKTEAETEKSKAIEARSDADAARERAEEARGAAELAEAQTKVELARANEVKKLITDMLGGASPAVARGADTSLLEEILNGTRQRLKD